MSEENGNLDQKSAIQKNLFFMAEHFNASSFLKQGEE